VASLALGLAWCWDVGLHSLGALMHCGQDYSTLGLLYTCLAVFQLRSPAGSRLTAHNHCYFCRCERGWWHWVWV